MPSDDFNLSNLKDALHEVAPFSIKDTNALIKKYNLKSDAVRIFNRYNGDEKKIKNFLKEQANTDASLSRASSNSFFSGIRKPSIVPTKHSTASIVHKGDMHGGNKSRRNTRTYRHSKKHKRVRHTRRKRTRRNHRSRRHR